MFSKRRTPESLTLDDVGKVAYDKDKKVGGDPITQIAGSTEEDDEILGMGEEKTKVIEDPFDESSLYHEQLPLTP